MSTRNLILEKKRKLEDEIKTLMNKFMDETGLIIDEIAASATFPPRPGSGASCQSEEQKYEAKKKALVESLYIKVIL